MANPASLFDAHGGASVATRIGEQGADVVLLPGFFAEADRLLEDLDETTIWQQETIRMYGKVSPIPRLTAWYGDSGRAYSYSGIGMDPEPWTPVLVEIKEQVEEQTPGYLFNSVLLNLYRDGRDAVAWHSDDEPELGPEPMIASASFGATRRFLLRLRSDHSVRHDLELTHGSLVLMRGTTQRLWEHQVPRTARPVGPRINLTFRTIH